MLKHAFAWTYTDPQIAWLADNDWGVEVSVGSACLTDPAYGPYDLTYWNAHGGIPEGYYPFTYYSWEDYLKVRCVDKLFTAGVPVHLEWEVPFEDGLYNDSALNPGGISAGFYQPMAIGLHVTETTTVAEYDNLWGDVLTEFEDTITVNGVTGEIAGHAWEQGYDNVVDWLSQNTDKELTCHINADLWLPATPLLGATDSVITDGDIGTRPLYRYGDNSISWRATKGYERLPDRTINIVAHFFSLNSLPRQNAALLYLRENYPDLNLGVCVYIMEGTAALPFLTDNFSGTISEVDVRKRCIKAIRELKDIINPIDIIVVLCANDVIEQCQFLESLNMGSPGTYVNQDMDEKGITPEYMGASICIRGTLPVDTFVNTGNELIIIKAIDVASTHDITVTSSLDPLTNSPYTITLSPERGTIIGPYPLDDYGALPTISYDNTNLYVSILKVEPYSDQT